MTLLPGKNWYAPPFLARKQFWGEEGGGVYVEPSAAGILIYPPFSHPTPHCQKGLFRGGGACIRDMRFWAPKCTNRKKNLQKNLGHLEHRTGRIQIGWSQECSGVLGQKCKRRRGKRYKCNELREIIRPEFCDVTKMKWLWEKEFPENQLMKCNPRVPNGMFHNFEGNGWPIFIQCGYWGELCSPYEVARPQLSTG